SSIPRKWCPEKCSHLRLFLFREALELSQLSRRGMVPRPRFERGGQAFSTLEVCQFPSSRHMVGACPRIRSAGACWSGHRESNPTAASLATIPHTMCIRVYWCMPLESNQLPSAYRADAHPHELRMRMLVREAGFEPAVSCARGTRSRPG